MRPIDADAVLDSVRAQVEFVKQLFGEDEDVTNISGMLDTTFKRQLELAPTLDVIPIEWIKKWLGASITSGLSIDVHTMLHDWEVMEGRK